MASIPRKSVKGANLKKWLVDTIDAILDYLHASRIRPGYGIAVDETPTGTIVRLAGTPSSNAPVSTGGGGTTGATGIESSVSGGTASITLTGGTGSVNLVGTGSVTISGNTNTGNIEINSSGGTSAVGFPNYQNSIVERGDVDLSGSTYSYNYPVWLIGNVGASSDENDQVRFGLDLWLGTSPNQERVGISNTANDYTFQGTITTFVCLPIPANTPFYFVSVDDLNLYINELVIYTCL